MSTSTKLQGKVAIVTGSGSGFGEAIAKRFAKEGAQVVVAEVRPEAGHRVEKDINSNNNLPSSTDSGGGGSRAFFQQTDVTSKASWEALLQATLSKYKRLDIVVNNAGTTHPKQPSHEVDESEWQKCIDVNMKSIYLSVAVLVPYFKSQQGGVILNTSSIGGLRVKEELVYYGASKAFVNKITEGLASEYGPYGIRINSICPLLGYTGLTSAFIGQEATPEFKKQFESTIPLRRGLDNEDIAKAAVFLVSDDSSFVTGVNMAVDGGSTCT